MVIYSKQDAKVRASFLILALVYFVVLAVFVTFYTFHLIEKQTAVQFKKEYSAYNQALMTTVDQMYGETGCYYSADKQTPSNFYGCKEFYRNLAKNLRVTKYCKDNALAKGCVPKYANYTSETKCAGFSESMFDKFNQVFVLEDRSSLIIYNFPTGVQKPMFAIDVNGHLNPNKSGYDLYSMVIMRSKNGNYYFHPNITYCLPVEEGGVNYITDVFNK